MSEGFALIARLMPKVRPEEVLYLAEGLDLLDSLFGRTMFLIARGKECSFALTIVMVVAGAVLGRVISDYGIFIIPGIPLTGGECCIVKPVFPKPGTMYLSYPRYMTYTLVMLVALIIQYDMRGVSGDAPYGKRCVRASRQCPQYKRE